MEVKELAPGVFAVLAADGTANAGFVVGDEQVLVVDTMMLPSQSEELLAAVQRVAPRVPKLVVITHFHGDHTFGNMYFRDSTIMAHHAVRRRMEEGGQAIIERFIRFRPEHADEFRKVQFVLPTLCYAEGLTLHLGHRRVEMFHPGPAHTDGDTFVYLPAEGVLFTGDLLFKGIFPAALPEANIRGWIKVLAQLESAPCETIVPGHGPLSRTQDLRTERQYLEQVLEEVRRCLARGVGKEDAVKAVGPGPGEGWQNPERHLMTVGQVYEELSRGE